MSNDQTQTSTIMTPIILVVSQNTDQKSAATSFLNDQFDWTFSTQSPRLRWINQDQNTISIEIVRELISELAYASHLGKPRAFVLLHSEQISLAAQHALLKSLEEPPAKTQIILVTPFHEKLLPTISSRCLLHFFQDHNQPLTEIILPSLITSLLDDPDSVDYHQLIDFANEYKDRDRASSLIRQMILDLHHQQKIDVNRQIKLQYILVKTLQNLEANANVRLALENCFFTIKK